ncbi:MAG TPA: lipoyl(octanoyl) transferase LipB [Asanoa sp.]|nr:lipoyl(octanoyl) transferase LipB [Asanoa sp.]
MDIRHLTGHVEYHEGWDLQRSTHESVRTEELADTVFFLEHASVYTAGARTNRDEYPTDGTEVIKVDRGGKITWHGPGQLVGYPIVKLADPIDVVQFVRRLEQALIAVCDKLGLATGRVEGRSGVWLAGDEHRKERKIAAIGIRVQRGVTMHGFELNCNADLAAFDKIVPCGIRDAGVTSLSQELGRKVTVAEVAPIAKTYVLAALDGTVPVEDRWIESASPEFSPVVTSR